MRDTAAGGPVKVACAGYKARTRLAGPLAVGTDTGRSRAYGTSQAA